jgi:hypothetical protein
MLVFVILVYIIRNIRILLQYQKEVVNR